MEKAWSEFAAARQHDLDKNWFEEYGENDGDWRGDLGDEKKAWDRYAHSASKVSMKELNENQLRRMKNNMPNRMHKKFNKRRPRKKMLSVLRKGRRPLKLLNKPWMRINMLTTSLTTSRIC